MTNADPAAPWNPLTPAEAVRLFGDFSGSWCVAGGWALDLFVGHQTRSHADLDILIPRQDLDRVHGFLPDWELFGANSGELTAWPSDAALDPTTHDIWCRRDGGPWEFQLMVTDADGTDWIYRRNPVVRGGLSEMILWTGEAIPILAPEIQLLYKSRSPRPKDELDFQQILPRLGTTRRDWLADALTRTDPGNPWIERLLSWQGPLDSTTVG